jgi:D-3-phosphoglycerate dehydrogenase
MKVLVAYKMSPEPLEKLKENHQVYAKELSRGELLELIKDYHALIVRTRTKVTKEVIDKGKKLKVISVASVGFNNIDVEYATGKKIAVTNAPKGSTYSVAELTIGMIISISRHLHKADKTMREGLWKKNALKGVELYGKTLGIIGSGRIGLEVARRAQAFGMKTLAYDPYAPAKELEKEGISSIGLDELLEGSDYVSIHAALTPETKGMINMDKLKKMKDSAYIVNIARGGIINEHDLALALSQNIIAGAALDVYQKEPPKDSPLLGLENVVLTPHLGATTIEGQKRASLTAAKEVNTVLAGDKPENLVNKGLYD